MLGSRARAFAHSLISAVSRRADASVADKPARARSSRRPRLSAPRTLRTLGLCLAAASLAFAVLPAGVAAVATDYFKVTVAASTTAGDAIDMTVEAHSLSDNSLDTAYTGTVHFTSTDGNIAVRLPDDYMFTAGNPGVTDDGTHTFSAGLTLATAGSQKVTATDSDGNTGQSEGTLVDPAAATTLVVTGSPTTVVAGALHDYTVTAKDAYGNVATGYTGTVGLSVDDGGSTLPSDHLFVPGDEGAYPFVGVALDEVGGRTLTATDQSVSSIKGALGITVDPAAATHLVVTGVTSMNAGATNDYLVTATDPYGNTDAGFLGEVGLSVDAGGSTLPSPYTFQASDNGAHTFPSVALERSGTRTLTAAETGHPSVFGDLVVTIAPDAATNLVVTGSTTVEAGSSNPYTVTAEDQYGNKDPNYVGNVALSVTPGGSSLPDAYTFTGPEAGVHQFNSVELNSVGSQTLTATDTGAPSINGHLDITVTPAAATVLVVTGSPTTVVAGSLHSYTVTAKDQFGNIDTNYAGHVALSIDSGGSTLPGAHLFIPGDAGVFQFDSVALNLVGPRSLIATDTDDTDITGTLGITVSPAAATHLVVSGSTINQAASTHDYLVTATDDYGNTDINYTGTVHLTVDAGTSTLPGDHTYVGADAGVFNFVGVALNLAGTRTLTARDTVHATITGGLGIQVNPAAATHLSVSAPASAVAGVPFSATVTALDASGNTDTDYTGTVALTVDSGGSTMPSAHAFTGPEAGVFTFTGVAVNKVGSRSLIANDQSFGSINGNTGINVTPAAATSLVIVGSTTNVAASTHDYLVTATDDYGNTDINYTGTVHLTVDAGTSTLPGDHTYVGADAGVFNFVGVALNLAGTRTLTARDTVHATITGGLGIQVNPAAATHLIVGAPGSATAGATFSVTVTAKDGSGNTVTNYTGTVALGVDSGGASLPSNHAFILADSGAFTFTGVALDKSGSRTLTAADTDNGSINGGASITINAAAATQLLVTGSTTDVTGTPHNYTVTAADQFGNTDPTYTGTVHLSVDSGTSTIPADHIYSGSDNGVYVFVGVVLNQVGGRTLTAVDTVHDTITGSLGVTVTSAAATHFVVSAPGSTNAGSSFSVTVTAKDAGGNTVTAYNGTAHFTSTDSVAILPGDYSFQGSDNGARTFTVTLKTVGSGTQTITVSGGSINGTSGAITVNPLATSQLAVSGISSPQIPGAVSSVTVTAEDTYGNTTPAYTGTIHFTTTDTSATVPGNRAFVGGDAGVHTFVSGVTFRTAGARTITATDTVTGTITGMLAVTVGYPSTSYFPIAPTRVLDTRAQVSSVVHVGNIASALVTGSVNAFQVAAAPYVKNHAVVSSPIMVPADAVAITGNLTVAVASSAGVVEIGPYVSASDSVNSISFGANEIRANNITVGLNPTGGLQAVFRGAGGATCDIIFDVTGYFLADTSPGVPATGGAKWHALTPGRVLDTRPTGSSVIHVDPFGSATGDAFQPKVPRNIKVAGVVGIGWSSAQVPSNASAVTGNVTVTNAGSIGYVAFGPTIQSVPDTSSVNTYAGQNTANGITVTLSGGNLQGVWVGDPGTSADVIFDITGYFTNDGSAGGQGYHPITPLRMGDTVTHAGGLTLFQPKTPQTMTIGGLGEIPSDASGISGNLTLAPTNIGYAFIGPIPVNVPGSSTVNVPQGRTYGNGFDVKLSSTSNGRVSIVWVGDPGTTANITVDVTGYWK